MHLEKNPTFVISISPPHIPSRRYDANKMLLPFPLNGSRKEYAITNTNTNSKLTSPVVKGHGTPQFYKRRTAAAPKATAAKLDATPRPFPAPVKGTVVAVELAGAVA